MKKRNSFCKTL